MTAKSVSTKGPGCKFGGCAAKAVELTPGGLSRVTSFRKAQDFDGLNIASDWGYREVSRPRGRSQQRA